VPLSVAPGDRREGPVFHRPLLADQSGKPPGRCRALLHQRAYAGSGMRGATIVNVDTAISAQDQVVADVLCETGFPRPSRKQTLYGKPSPSAGAARSSACISFSPSRLRIQQPSAHRPPGSART
jgi:hypothetical protein